MRLRRLLFRLRPEEAVALAFVLPTTWLTIAAYVYAREAGLPPRLVIPVPVLTPRLSSYWIHLVTPVHAEVARPLAEVGDEGRRRVGEQPRGAGDVRGDGGLAP